MGIRILNPSSIKADLVPGPAHGTSRSSRSATKASGTLFFASDPCSLCELTLALIPGSGIVPYTQDGLKARVPSLMDGKNGAAAPSEFSTGDPIRQRNQSIAGTGERRGE